MRRHSYTIKYKLRALDKLRENDNNIRKTARELDVSPTTIRYWRDSEDQLKSLKGAPARRRLGNGKKSKHPELEQGLNEWVAQERVNNPGIDYKQVLAKIAELEVINQKKYPRNRDFVYDFLRVNKLKVREKRPSTKERPS